MESPTWDDSPGVIELPDGTRFRGRGLRRPLPPGARADHALFLLGREPTAEQRAQVDGDVRWVRWPDFRLPADRDDAIDALTEAHARARHERVEIACGGWRGRTGTALSCLAVLSGVPAEDAVEHVRAEYDRRAVETPFQRRFVRWFADQLR